MKVVLEPFYSVSSANDLNEVSRPSLLLWFRRLCDVFFLGISTSDFNLSHFDTCYYFDVSSQGVSSLVQKTFMASSSLVSQPVTSTLVTLIPVDTLMPQVKVYLTPSSSSSSTRTSMLRSSCSTPSPLTSPNLEKEQFHLLGRDGILGKEGDHLFNNEWGEINIIFVKNFVIGTFFILYFCKKCYFYILI